MKSDLGGKKMPKMKTHKGTKKRVKVTGSGKISLNLFLKKQFNKFITFI